MSSQRLKLVVFNVQLEQLEKFFKMPKRLNIHFAPTYFVPFLKRLTFHHSKILLSLSHWSTVFKFYVILRITIIQPDTENLYIFHEKG